MRLSLAILMGLHGIAHMVGFAVPWRLAKPPDGVYKTTILGDRVDLGSVGIRVYGVLWLVLGIAFLFTAIATATAHPRWVTLASQVCLLSLVPNLASWPSSRIGVGVNVVILAWVHTGRWLGWF